MQIEPEIEGTKVHKQRVYKWTIIGVALFVIVVLVTLAIVLPLTLHKKADDSQDPIDCSGKVSYVNYNSAFEKFKNAAVAVDSSFCAPIGKNILLESGSAVDAAIAVGLCNGVSNPYSMGIGGGHFMLIYLKEEKKMVAIDARETAPMKSSETMFVNNSELSYIGGLATGIPGEIAGYWAAHQIAGKLPWKRLFAPTIEACRKGIPVAEKLARASKQLEKEIRKDAELSKVFINPLNNQTYSPKETIKYPKFANTLEKIAEGGLDTFYNGELSQIIVNENNVKGGILTLEDLRNYKPEFRIPIEVKLKDKYRVFGLPPPSSAILISFVLNVMSRFNLTKESMNSMEDKVLFYHRLMETLKHTFAKRSFLGDMNFVDVTELMKNLTSLEYIDQIVKKIDDSKTFSESYYEPAWSVENDHGTAHIAVLAANGDAVALTSTINTFFGASYAGETTGIIYNNQMDDFSTPGTVNYYGVPASQSNYIKPGKKPMSSMSPIIILDENDNVRLIIGAEGGTHIISSVSTVAVRNLWLEQSLKEAIDAPRLHHQLFPNKIGFESDFPEDLFPQKEFIKGLMKKKHSFECFDLGHSTVEAIDRQQNGEISACSDFRKNGDVAGY